MKIKPRKRNSLKSHIFKPRTRLTSISEPLHHSVTKQCKSTSNPDIKTGSNLSSSLIKISKSSCKTS